MSYRITSLDRISGKKIIKCTRFARKAKNFCDLAVSLKESIVVSGSEGEITKLELTKLAELDHRYVR